MNEGTLILCRCCRKAFMRVVKPLRRGQPIGAEHFRFLSKEGPFHGDRMTCAECGAGFSDFTTLKLPVADSVQYTKE